LQQAPRLAGDHFIEFTGKVLGIEDAQRRAIAGRGEPPGVAVGEDPPGRSQRDPPMLRDGGAGTPILLLDCERLGERGTRDGLWSFLVPAARGCAHARDGRS
jgi:hypothetical protein